MDIIITIIVVTIIVTSIFISSTSIRRGGGRGSNGGRVKCNALVA